MSKKVKKVVDNTLFLCNNLNIETTLHIIKNKVLLEMYLWGIKLVLRLGDRDTRNGVLKDWGILKDTVLAMKFLLCKKGWLCGITTGE